MSPFARFQSSIPPTWILRYVVGRVVWAVVTVYLVVTGMFALFVLAPDWTNAPALWAIARSGEIPDVPPEEPPLIEQYVDWLSSLVTLDWGQSATAAGRGGSTPRFGGASNVEAVADAVPVTLAYVIPSTVVAFGLALVLGYYAARRPRSIRDRLLSASTYLAFSVPNFFLAAVMFYTLRDLDPAWFPDEFAVGAGFSVDNLVWLVLPAFVLTSHLVAAHFRYSRAETRVALTRQYVTLVQAKGTSPTRVARHVFRNAALPLLTLFVTELVGVLLVAVFVLEAVFHVPGVGDLAYDAVVNRDLDLVMVLTAAFAVVVVASNLLQDLAYLALDPRAGE